MAMQDMLRIVGKRRLDNSAGYESAVEEASKLLGRAAQTGAHDGDRAAFISAGVAVHVAYFVIQFRAVEEIFGYELSPQGVARKQY